MAPSILKKRKVDDLAQSKPTKKARKQEYHSSASSASAEDNERQVNFAAVDLANSDTDSGTSHGVSVTQSQTPSGPPSDDDSIPSDDKSSQSSAASSTAPNSTTPSKNKKTKRTDPDAFATSISSILNSNLSNAKRSDPVLARSATAASASASVLNDRLESRARSQLRQDRKSALEKGRVKDVLLGTDADGDVGSMMEEEKRLRKTAQRGVVKLFNAVRQAQVRGEEARREAMSKGGSARGRTEEKVAEMTKQGFLEMVAQGGKKAEGAKAMAAAAEIEEA